MTEDDGPQWSVFAEGKITCPQCQQPIPVPVLARMNASETEQALELQPDMAEAWAHSFTHDVAATP